MSAAVFGKLLVIFVVVAIGWIAGRRFVKGSESARAVAGLAFYVFAPALLFRTTARVDFAQLDGRVMLAFFAPLLASIGVVYAIDRWRRRGVEASSPAAPSVRAITAGFGNLLQIGIPVAAGVFGETGLAIHVTIVSVHSLVLLTLLTTLVEADLARADASGARRRRLLRVVATTARHTLLHPVVLPVIAGLAWNAAGLPLPTLVDDALLLLGQGVVPVCLVLIGLSLAAYGVHGALSGAVALAAVKLLLVPLVVLVTARWGFGLTGLPLQVVVMTAAMPVGSNALLFAQRYATLEAETTAATVISTLAFVATAPLWLAAGQAVS